jgi:hydroxymethylbilane synthase
LSDAARPSPIATRRSALALAQAHETQARLARASGENDPDRFPILGLVSTGDRLLGGALSEVGGKGLFTKEIDAALMEARADFAVHSMKDVPTQLPEGMVIGAYLEREDPRDLLLTADGAIRLEDLPEGAVIGTASLRRQAQALHKRPDLKTRLIRGNVETRINKLKSGEVHATFLARAGLRRLDREEGRGEPLAVTSMLPAAGQGAIGVAVRADDKAALALCALLDHAPTRRAVEAERGFLDALDGSCRTPIAAHAVEEGDALRLVGEALSPDGRSCWRREALIAEGDDPTAAGHALGEAVRVEGGAALDAARAAS